MSLHRASIGLAKLIFVAGFAPAAAFGYDLNFKCDENNQLQEHRYIAQSLGDLVGARRSINPQGHAADLCRDLKKCFGEMADLAKVARDNSDVVQKYMADFERKNGADDSRVQRYHSEVGRLQELLGDCVSYRGLKLSDADRGTVTLFYPFKGPVSGKVSRNYDRSPLESLVRTALREGVDPYLVMALKLLEDPPIKSSRPLRSVTIESPWGESTFRTGTENSSYRKSYGLLPIDQIAAMQSLGCGVQRRDALRSSVPAEVVRKVELLRQKSAPIGVRALKAETADTRRYNDLTSEVAAVDSNVVSWRAHLENLNRLSDVPDLESRRAEARRGLKKSEARLESLNQQLKELAGKTSVANYLKLTAENSKLNETSDQLINEAVKNLDPRQATAARCVLSGRAQCYGVASRQAVVPEIVLQTAQGDRSRQTWCASDDMVSTGGSLDLSASNATGACCVNVVADAKADSEQVLSDVMTSLAVGYAKNRVQKDANPNVDLSWAIQAYNGRGCFGCTEGQGYYGNTCMGHIDMNKRPVYGAKAADLMVNSLMRNPEIVNMVEAAAAERNTRPVSVLCMVNGAGTHQISDAKFLRQQEQYLLHSEPARAKLCRPLFENKFRAGV